MKFEIRDCSLEYCASIVKIEKLETVTGSDNLVKTIINGYPILVNKNEVREGDIMIYSPIETEINYDFLRNNNLFCWKSKELNHNYPEISMLLTEGYTYDELKYKVGYFNENCRVKIVNLLKQPSCGVLFSIDSFNRWLQFCPPYIESELTYKDLSDFVGTKFNYIEGVKFCDVYIPKSINSNKSPKKIKTRKINKKIDRLVPGQFYFHYDTNQFGDNLNRFNPETEVDISIKIHGTSVVLGNLETFKPKFKTGIRLIDSVLFRVLPKSWIFRKEYDLIYSSRRVIKNDDINPYKDKSYYESNIWKEYADLLKDYIPKGVTIYGEIFGYETGTSKFIQKDYDYGCKEGTNKIMIYRITQHTSDDIEEWEVEKVINWIEEIRSINEGLKDKVFPFTRVFSGSLSEICSNCPDWSLNLLNSLKETFKIEEDESLCKNKVPREGIVIRIKRDPVKEAFKLKGTKFFYRESKQIDNGEIDLELTENLS